MSNTKLVRLGKKGQIVIPKALREIMGIEVGDQLLMTLKGDQLCIAPPEKYAAITRGLLKGVWGDEQKKIDAYLDKERESWE